MRECAQIPGETGAVCKNLEGNGGVARDAELIENPSANGDEAENEGSQNVGGSPAVAATRPGKAEDGNGRASNDDEITAVRLASIRQRMLRSLDTYYQSTRRTFSRIVPGGVRTRRKSRTRVNATPEIGKLM